MVSLYTGRCVVMHLYSIFCGPRNFPLRANLYQKLPFFLRLWGLYAHIFKAITTKFGMRVRTWDSLLRAKFCKNRLKCIAFCANLYQKYQFWRFGGCRPTFLCHNSEIWHEGADLELPPQAKFCIKKSV